MNLEMDMLENSLINLLSPEAQTSLKVEMLKKEALQNPANKWPDNHINNEDNQPVPFHTGQQLAWDSQRRIVAFIAGTQSGKALSVDTLIPTPFGFSKMGDLNIGDIVYGGNGKETKIVYVSETFYNHDCYKVYFDTGEEIVCDAEHLWIVRDFNSRKNSTKEYVLSTNEMKDSFICKDKSCNYSIDITKKIYGKRNHSIYSAISSSNKYLFKYITNIEKIESVPTKCIAVDNEEHSYLVGKSFIKTHNTSWGPFWLRNEIYRRHGGDFIAVTSTYDLFKLKMLPVMIHVFEHIYGIGRYWTGDKVIEIADPETGKFLAKKSQDRMWGRIILRSADALSGLESATARAAWMDECGQSQFSIMAYRAIRRRLALHRGRILMTTTLYDLGWLLEHIVEPAIIDGKTEYFLQNGGEIEYTDNEQKDVAIIQLDSIVNPAFPRSEYDEAKESMSDEDFQMQYRGRKASRRFLIYDCFDTKTHTIDAFPIPDDWNRFVGVDFGSVHMAAVFYAEDPVSKTLYCYREYLAGNTTISQHVIGIRNGEPNRLRCVGGAGNEGQWRTEFTRNGLFVEEPGIIDVNLGINRVYTQLKNNGIMYFRGVNGVIDEKGKYRRKRDNSTGLALEDIEHKNDFHFTDCERYIISKIRPGIISTRARVINLWEAMNEQQQFSG
jgi:hypothetical protein